MSVGNAVLKCIEERKSVRAFEDKPIDEETMRAIYNAAIQAPSAGNQQQYTILRITDESLKEDLAKACDHQLWITKAPLVLVFLADPTRYYNAYKMADIDARPLGKGDLLLAIDDALIAAQNTVIAAESMGIGSCYIGDIMEQKETIQNLLHLPMYVFPACMLVYGYPSKQQKNCIKPKRFKPEDLIFENVYPNNDEAYYQKVFERELSATHPTVNQALDAFCKRKYNSDFAKEMSRSVDAYLKEYEK